MFSIRDVAPYQIEQTATLREAMERINQSPQQFQVVMAAGRVVGTLTDGDIRRSLLRGMALDSVVRDCMQGSPTTGHIGAQGHNLDLLINRRLAFIPVVDDAGMLHEILVSAAIAEKIKAAVVMAGGFGRRLGEHTRSKPKPLVEVGGKALIERALGWIEKAGIETAYVTIHHLAEQIESFLAERKGKLKCQTVYEAQPLGTAGALGEFAGFDGPILVVNADVLTNFDLLKMMEFHHHHGHDATIAAVAHEYEVPFGVIRHTEDGRFLGMEEKPRLRHFVSAGVYILSPVVLSLIVKGRQMDMPDLLNAGREIGLRFGVFPVHEYWRDVGRPEDLHAAREDFEQAE